MSTPNAVHIRPNTMKKPTPTASHIRKPTTSQPEATIDPQTAATGFLQTNRLAFHDDPKRFFIFVEKRQKQISTEEIPAIFWFATAVVCHGSTRMQDTREGLPLRISAGAFSSSS